MKQRFFAALCALIALCGLLTACERKPESLENVRAYLDEALTIKYEYISTTIVVDAEGYTTNIYNFQDANGVYIVVEASRARGHMSFGRKITECNYIDVLMTLHENALAEDFGTALSWEKRTDRHVHYILSIERYADLPAAANSVSAALNTVNPAFPVNRDLYDRYFPYSLPYIEIRHTQGNNDFEEVYFPCVGEMRMSQEQILEELQYEYADNVKLGVLEVEEQLPEGILTKYPVSRIREVYANGQQLHSTTYMFEYNRALQEYVIGKLNPCEPHGDTSLSLKN